MANPGYKTIAGWAITILTGTVFLYSGYSKLFPVIETFEFTFVDLGLGNWYTAPIIARLLVGLELFAGILFLTGYRLRSFTVPLGITLLLIFTAYLVIQIGLSGNEGNCGCFGEQIYMTPLQAVVKNCVMLAALLLLRKWYAGWAFRRMNATAVVLAFLVSAVLPFVLNPVDYTYSSNNLDEKVNYPLDLELLYQPQDSSKVEIPSVDLRRGKHVIAFLSLRCPHCRIAAKKFRLIKKNNPGLPVYFILNGDREELKEFHDDTRTADIPYSFCLGKTFVRLASAELPRIYYLDNGVVVKKVDYFELSQYHIEEWIAGEARP